MKRLCVGVYYQAYGHSFIDVPDELNIDEAIQYAKDHWDGVPLPSGAEYVLGSDEIDEEGCDFEED